MAIGCPDCGTVQEIPQLPLRGKASCRTCHADLEKTSGRSITAGFACSFATLLLLIPANVLPLIRVDLLGMHASNVIAAGIARLWDAGWIFLAGISAVCVIILPFIRFGLLSAVLGALRIGRRPQWLGPVYRWSLWLDPWAMTDVFLLAFFIGYYRLANISQANISLEPGGECFIAAALLTMVSRAAIDRRSIWRAIGPEAALSPEVPALSCTTCDLIQPMEAEGDACPRCGARLRARKLDAMPRTAALLIASFLLFFPANIYPMNVSTQLGTQQSYTIFSGIRELFLHGLWPLGALVFCTSILIPIGKIFAVGWCVLGVWRRWGGHLIGRTTVFRLVAELGRWSKTDPFTIVFFVPLINFGGLGSAGAGWGATAFLAMTTLTMFASISFDPRLMWDVAPPESAGS